MKRISKIIEDTVLLAVAIAIYIYRIDKLMKQFI